MCNLRKETKPYEIFMSYQQKDGPQTTIDCINSRNYRWRILLWQQWPGTVCLFFISSICHFVTQLSHSVKLLGSRLVIFIMIQKLHQKDNGSSPSEVYSPPTVQGLMSYLLFWTNSEYATSYFGLVNWCDSTKSEKVPVGHVWHYVYTKECLLFTLDTQTHTHTQMLSAGIISTPGKMTE